MQQYVIHTFIVLNNNYISNKWLSNDWHDAAERIEYLLEFPKPFLSLSEKAFAEFVDKAQDNEKQKPHVFILSDLGTDYNVKMQVTKWLSE